MENVRTRVLPIRYSTDSATSYDVLKASRRQPQGAAQLDAGKLQGKAVGIFKIDQLGLQVAQLYRESRFAAQGVVLTTWIRRSMLVPMTKGRSSSSDRLGAVTTAVAERPSAGDAKGSINLRIETQTRRLIDNAATVLGKTRTEFMIESARKVAIDVLLDQRLFALDPERYDVFVHALDNPPAPGPKLRSLLRRAPAWET